MALTDDELLDFDAHRLADYGEREAREALAGQHGDIYRAQLVAARWFDGWRQRTLEYDRTPLLGGRSEDRTAGWDEALREVIAHLRQGDLIPSGILYREEAGEV